MPIVPFVIELEYYNFAHIQSEDFKYDTALDTRSRNYETGR